MSEQLGPISTELADAFADAVLAYEAWSLGGPERMVRIEQQLFPILSVCDFIDGYSDPLPPHVRQKLESFMHDMPHSELKARLAVDQSYAAGAWCLRSLIDRLGLRNRPS